MARSTRVECELRVLSICRLWIGCRLLIWLPRRPGSARDLEPGLFIISRKDQAPTLCDGNTFDTKKFPAVIPPGVSTANAVAEFGQHRALA